MKTQYHAAVLAAGLLAFLAACSREAPKAPEKISVITTATVKTRDLPMVESAVGAETVVGAALDFDPTRDTARRFFVRLPFPIHVARQIRVGQPISLTNFTDNRTVNGRIRQIMPALNSLTQTIEIIAEVPNAGTWRPDGSIRGEIVLGIRRNALVVPEQAVVLRPAGTVIYVPDNGVARERVVKQGILRDGEIEITSGVKNGETVIVDGAGLLTDGARVKLREATAPAPAPAAAKDKP
jgi:membrane fusion protein, multidrug efflux system